MARTWSEVSLPAESAKRTPERSCPTTAVSCSSARSTVGLGPITATPAAWVLGGRHALGPGTTVKTMSAEGARDWIRDACRPPALMGCVGSDGAREITIGGPRFYERLDVGGRPDMVDARMSLASRLAADGTRMVALRPVSTSRPPASGRRIERGVGFDRWGDLDLTDDCQGFWMTGWTASGSCPTA